ncbi:hypothetical protein [cf. Phormidesmis sp. LEGE 11477]|uniref:hypothetical protein n=1 Tax=cf. Phormidesmis sp. LEGE 11477 TaxID=1828680 RepID=UPI00187F5C06|nr:hypothetical protein [cf. Phormidesmis sp. LEGE 11477]MBE9060017.1 hypothetical protein [cf. Phormidesmis sp. LEGE 11477]
MFKSLGLEQSSSSISEEALELLVRTAITHRELSPGVAAQIDRYRSGQLTCRERRLLAILDDAIAGGHVVPVDLPVELSAAAISSRRLLYSAI